ncbi:MAG: hypothetical protein OEP52_07360 [Acidimicrobiia bacterium]|nr:hypothetical protein [Acidimicrobiia bacterium]
MKKVLAIFVAVATLMALAVPALAAPGGKKGPPGVGLTMSSNLYWAHEGDLIIYTIDVTNDTDDELTVEFGGVEDGELVWEVVGVVPAGETATFDKDYFVDSVPEPGQEITLTNIVKAFAGDTEVASDTVETAIFAYEECDDNGDGVFTSPDGYSVCIWQPSAGDWALHVTPADESAKRGLIAMNLRDHVPGNWCPFTDENGDPLDGMRWRGTPTTLTFRVNVPSPGDHWDLTGTAWHGEPICPNGGAGGAPFDVGTSGSFYLATYDDYRITTEPLSP